MDTHDHAMTHTAAVKQSKLTLAWQQLTQKPAVRWLRNNALVLVAIPWAVTVSYWALSATTAPNIPVIPLSADPLYAATGGDKPLLALALSVEFPTVGAQYLDPANATGGATQDGSYSNSSEYLGYYDAESCYTYNKSPTETPVSPQTASDFKRFDRIGPAIALTTPDPSQPLKTSRKCTDAFSGNFLNWASSSAIDMLRLALTGGDRYIDTPTLTILQRAVLPHDGNGFPSGYARFWNSTNFPGKQLLRSGGSSGTAFFGAVPNAMVTAAGTNDIWVVNELNKIYFGTSKVGSDSGSAGSYTLGGPVSGGSGVGTVVNPYQTPSTALTVFQSGASNFTECPHTLQSGYSSEGLVCSFSGTKEVLYGAPPGSPPAGAGNPGGWLTYVATGGVTCGNTMTGSTIDPIQGVYKRCYYRDYTAPPTSTTLNDDGFFYARVQVCDRNPSTYALNDVRDYGLCKTYSDGQTTPHASYKPTGVIQKYSDQLRIAVFGYLMDQVDSRYGGVLRAPVKYVGAKTFDTSGVELGGTNANMEWNATTGVFVANPDGNSTILSKSGSYLSGVINYVNQFGRTGAVDGRYKIYDPLSELHYETLRYLQGLAPSASAISGITTDMYDGYPVATTWTDPYGGGRSATADYSCVKSNIVMIGDKNTQERSGRLPTASATDNILDIAAWSTTVQNFEKKTSSTYTDGQGVSRNTSLNPNTANSSVPSGLNSQIMGSAYWARTHDIRGSGWTGTGGPALQRPGLRVKTFMFDVNEFSGSTDNTARRTSNQLFMTAKYGGFETDPSNAAANVVTGKSNANTYNTKGNPFYQDDLTTADQYVWQDTDARTSRVGEASTYFLQSDARSVLSAFEDIFSRVTTAARSIAGGAIQSGQLIVGEANAIYQGSFDTADWSGNLTSIPISVDSSFNVTTSSTANWTAATQLGALTSPATSRNIVVGNVNATAATASAFIWTDIETGLAAHLDKASPTAPADGLAQDRLNYLRGDRSKEGNPFRTRTKLLGDIINSGVAFSGNPTDEISSPTYTTFRNALIEVTGAGGHAARTPAVFVGANDGMLHAFNASNGNELFAYIPSWLGPKLSALTNRAYVTAHQSYVDGTPVVAEAQVTVSNPEVAADWKTVLVSGTGGGGQGVFALDVTDPEAFSASKVMWEFTNHDDPDMGFVTGRPQILKLRTSAAYNTSATYKWFAVVPSGVNNYSSANSAGEFGSGYPVLFLLELGKAAGTSWTPGTNYYKISLPIDSTLSPPKATGLVNFAATLGNAREVAQMYLGDLHGNIWKLDFSRADIAHKDNWTMAKLSAFKKVTDGSPYPLYIAKDGAGNVQPITMAPQVVPGATPTSRYVIFGTGKYMETADKSSIDQQTVYMIYDDTSNTSGDANPEGASVISSRSRLRAGSSTALTGAVVFQPFVAGRATSDTDTGLAATTVRSGCYFDFSTSGERQISGAKLLGEKIAFGSLIPSASSGSSCSAGGGGGKQYTIDICGNGSATDSTVGLLGEPLLIEVPGATTRTISDSTGRRTKTVTYAVIQQGSAGVSGTPTTTTVTSIIGRLSWRQINNYQDLKNAP